MKSTILLLVLSLLFVAALDLTAIKLAYCDKLKGHWAYDRLRLKHTCLQMAKQKGSELCLDVNKILLYFVH